MYWCSCRTSNSWWSFLWQLLYVRGRPNRQLCSVESSVLLQFAQSHLVCICCYLKNLTNVAVGYVKNGLWYLASLACFLLWLFSLNKIISLLFGDILDACKVIWWPFQNVKRDAVHLQVHILHTTLLFDCVGLPECYSFWTEYNNFRQQLDERFVF
jgi:hypothetical protein